MRALSLLPCRFWGGPEKQTLRLAAWLRDHAGVETVLAVMPTDAASLDDNPLLLRAREAGFEAAPFVQSRRYDLIEGVLYEMPAPGWDHATTIMNLISLLLPVVTAMGGLLRTASVDVFFEGADPVQPDILVLLPGWHGQVQQRGPQGAPNLLAGRKALPIS